MRLYLRLLLLLPVVVLSGCAANPVTGESDFVLISESQELALGRKLHKEVLKEYERYDNPSLQAYVRKTGEEIAVKSHRDDLIYRFTVLDSMDVNAFAIPGGYIYITRGLLAHLNSEEELAAVLGHEIGHITARHSVRQYTASQAANIGYILGGILAPELRTNTLGNLYSLLGTAIVRGYGREHELEADRLSAEYLAHTGRDPKAMITAIEVLKSHELLEKQVAKAENREPQTYHGLFSTHPDNDKRLQEVVNRAATLRIENRRITDPNDYLRRLAGMTYGPSAKEGILRGNHFYHGDLGFTLSFPEGWRVKNHPDRLVASSPDNDAKLQLSMTELNKRQSPQDFMRNRLGLKKLLREESLNINGLTGHTGFATTDTSWGSRLARFSVLFFNDRAYLLLSAVKNEDDPRLYNTPILNTVYSFHPLTESEKQLARELEIDLITAKEDTRFSDLARDSLLQDHGEERIRLLNGYYPNGEPRVGELLKVVR